MSERKIVDFILVAANNIVKFNFDVSKAIKEGWEIHGTYTIKFIPASGSTEDCYSWTSEMYTQAMVKYEEINSLCDHKVIFEICNMPKFNYYICNNCGDFEKKLKPIAKED